jgi:predicted lipoprotein with Yx(FWY)xxD motif
MIVAALLGGCSSYGSSAGTPAATPPTTGATVISAVQATTAASATPAAATSAATLATAAGAATVKIATDAKLGRILADSQGLTLYTFKNDVAGSGKSAVSGGLAQAWPPLILTSGSPAKPDGLAGELTLITRDDGAKQVTYQGMPLYRFASDKAPGETNGQGIGGVWFAAMP